MASVALLAGLDAHGSAVDVAESGSVSRALMKLVRSSEDGALARGICEACVAGLAVDGAALSLLTVEPSRETLWATDDTAALLEDLQFTLNEGACVEAATSGRAVLVPDLRDSVHTARWPVFAAEVAARSQVGALFALPLQWGAINLGVLDLYRVEPGELDPVQVRDALSAADIAALMLLGQRTEPPATSFEVVRPEEAEWADGWLDPATSSRAEVHQATGMVLVQLGVTAADALARMRGHAFVQQRLLIDVARDVVARRLVFTRDEDGA